MAGVFDGMERAWRLGISHLDIQLDSLTAISLLQAEGSCDHQHPTLVFKFRRLLLCNWTVRLRHVYKKTNNVVDYLAKLGYSMALGSHEISLPNEVLIRWLLPNLVGEKLTRAIRTL
ncbi:Putative ribonuclease H protein At1g65750 [Linum grandiflorum]